MWGHCGFPLGSAWVLSLHCSMSVWEVMSYWWRVFVGVPSVGSDLFCCGGVASRLYRHAYLV